MTDKAFADIMVALRQIEAFLGKQPSGINRVAWHEAGHVVAACALGYSPIRATICENGEDLGRVTVVDNMSAEHRAIFLMAGTVAEIKALQRAGAHVSVADIVNTSRGDIASLRQMHALGARLDISAPLAAATTLLDMNWHRVESVAFAFAFALQRPSDKDFELIEIWKAYNV